MKGQKCGKNSYVILRGFSVQNAKTRKQIRYGRGEPIPQEIIKDPDKVAMLLQTGKLAIVNGDGTILENPHEVKLSDADIKNLVENPKELMAVLRPVTLGQKGIRFDEGSLQKVMQLLVAKQAPQQCIDMVQQVLNG